MWSKGLVVAGFLLVLSLPFVVRGMVGGVIGGGSGVVEGERVLVVVTPHIEQIRVEFSRGFRAWHEREHGEPAYIDWRTPGGTSEIIKQLQSQYARAAQEGLLGADGRFEPGAVGYDVLFGGGSYDHGRLKREMSAEVGGEEVSYSMSVPMDFSDDELEDLFGLNEVASGTLSDPRRQRLYDDGQYWIGTALSGFGIVYNRDVLERLGLEEPRTFDDLTDFRYFNQLALADGRMSGSVTTTYDSILNNSGWEEGWRILRDLSANARYFASASTRPPIDVSQGEAAAGLAIDFYGRAQAQLVMRPGETAETSRVGYVDPVGTVYIDADPVSILNGASHEGLARRFVRYLLSEEAQALWQFYTVGSDRGASNPVGADGEPMGPVQSELRRMPVRRVMYEKYLDVMVDRVVPFEIASSVRNKGWRSAIGPMMGSFGVENHGAIREAWRALHEARAAAERDPALAGLVQEMESAFYAMPVHVMRDGSELVFNEANYESIKDDAGRWSGSVHAEQTLIRYNRFFRERYAAVVEMWRSRGREPTS